MTISAFQYHRLTEYDRDRMTGHYLDWQNQPTVYKSYPGIEPIALPRDFKPREKRLSEILKEMGGDNQTRPIDIKGLSLIFYLTNSLTAKTRHAGGDFYYRGAASAGALYPTEIYVTSKDIHGLEDGLYHYSIAHHGLNLLRRGNFSVPETEQTLTFFLTAIFFRSAWKYRDRSYRYHLLDTGHVAENLVLALRSLGLPFTLSYDFDDARLNRLLGLDDKKEVSLALVGVHGGEPTGPQELLEVKGLPEEIGRASRVAEKEIDYPAIKEIHSAGATLIVPEESPPDMLSGTGTIPDQWIRIDPPDPWPESMAYDETVFHRRSRRNFIKETIPKDRFGALLNALCTEASSNSFSKTGYQETICTGFLLGSAEGFFPGFYLMNTGKKSTGLVASGPFMEKMARVCLDQAWLANAGVHFLFVTNLDLLDSTWGARGYRYAMMHAGRMGERLYLAATAMGLGCCGIGAFYDMEAAALLGLEPASRLLYLVAVGQVKR